MMSYGLLFLSAFLAATLLPFYSEVVLVSLLLEGKPALALWFYATLGNTLGAWVNWVMGRYCTYLYRRRDARALVGAVAVMWDWKRRSLCCRHLADRCYRHIAWPLMTSVLSHCTLMDLLVSCHNPDDVF